MFNPNKGTDEGKKPGLAVAISFGKPKGFNPNKGEEPDGDEYPSNSGDPDQLMDKACEGICEALNVSSKAAPRLREYLEAFFHAADSKPHDEGEHTNEEDEEGEEN